MILYTTKEVAKELRISVSTLHRLVYEGEISYINMGTPKKSILRFKPEHIEDFLSKNESKAI